MFFVEHIFIPRTEWPFILRLYALGGGDIKCALRRW